MNCWILEEENGFINIQMQTSTARPTQKVSFLEQNLTFSESSGDGIDLFSFFEIV
jgi:hypothetical protein